MTHRPDPLSSIVLALVGIIMIIVIFGMAEVIFPSLMRCIR